MDEFKTTGSIEQAVEEGTLDVFTHILTADYSQPLQQCIDAMATGNEQQFRAMWPAAAHDIFVYNMFDQAIISGITWAIRIMSPENFTLRRMLPDEAFTNVRFLNTIPGFKVKDAAMQELEREELERQDKDQRERKDRRARAETRRRSDVAHRSKRVQRATRVVKQPPHRSRTRYGNTRC